MHDPRPEQPPRGPGRAWEAAAKVAKSGHLARSVRSKLWPVWPPVGWVRFGGLRRKMPISPYYGFDRGLPIDRYYIERFLGRYTDAARYGGGDIRGHVLEVGDDLYMRKFGRLDNPEPSTGRPPSVEKLDVLHVSEENPKATIVGDLATGDGIPSEGFDCVICTQTLHVIYDVHAAVATLHRMLSPGGVLLATLPGITAKCNPDSDLWGDFWRFTTQSARRLFEERFVGENLIVDAYGNVLAAAAFLYGLAAAELETEELELRDANYELLITVRAVKGKAA